jgi:hypothetical protein
MPMQINRNDTAVVIIDPQNDGLSDKGPDQLSLSRTRRSAYRRACRHVAALTDCPGTCRLRHYR